MANKLIGSVGLADSGVPDDLLTTKGDTHGFSSTNARIPIGDDDTVLTADSSEALGLKWATGGGGAWEVIETYKSPSTASTKTFTFDAIDFDDYSELVLTIDGSITAPLGIRVAINDLAEGMYTDGFRVRGGAITIIDAGNIAYAEIGSIEMFENADDSIATISHFAFGIDDEQNTSIYSVAYPAREGFEVTNNIHNAHIDSITSIVVNTSTSTWKAGTRMTLYKVSRS